MEQKYLMIIAAGIIVISAGIGAYVLFPTAPDVDEAAPENDDGNDVPTRDPPTDFITMNGSMILVDGENAYYGIAGDDGWNYTPMTPVETLFEVGGVRVTFTGEIQDDLFTPSMWGLPIEITTMNRLDAGAGT